MNTNITGRIICAGRLKDNNGDEFYGMMIECDLRDRKVPYYQEVEITEITKLEVQDRTQLELPWGDLPEPPPLPEGKTRWVHRGEFDYLEDEEYRFFNNRIIYYKSYNGEWVRTMHFGGDIPHIEAI